MYFFLHFLFEFEYGMKGNKGRKMLKKKTAHWTIIKVIEICEHCTKMWEILLKFVFFCGHFV